MIAPPFRLARVVAMQARGFLSYRWLRNVGGDRCSRLDCGRLQHCGESYLKAPNTGNALDRCMQVRINCAACFPGCRAAWRSLTFGSCSWSDFFASDSDLAQHD